MARDSHTTTKRSSRSAQQRKRATTSPKVPAVDTSPSSTDVPTRLVEAAVKLLALHGPGAIKARTVAAECDLSTMVVYSHFGGVPELLAAVADHGFVQLGGAFAGVPASDDPVADLFGMAIACRAFARGSPHLYDLMFGLSTRATYRPVSEAGERRSGRSAAFRSAYVLLIESCARLVKSGRVKRGTPEGIAAQLWSFVHGFISLELSEHFADFNDPLSQVLMPMGVTFCVGAGDTEESARTSHQAALRRHARARGKATPTTPGA